MEILALRQGPQAMMFLHQFLITRLFGRINGPDKNFFQIQNGYPQIKQDYVPLYLIWWQMSIFSYNN
jgi:hypothetical protein